MQRRRFSILSSIALAALAALAMGGCASESNDTTPDQTTPAETIDQAEDTSTGPGAVGEATLSFGDNTYTAELMFCSLTASEDALFHGLAFDESGSQVGYLDGDFGILEGDAFGEARIDFGATAQFESTDDFIAIGDAASHIVVTSFSDTDWHIIGGGWDQNGTQQSNVSLQVSC